MIVLLLLFGLALGAVVPPEKQRVALQRGSCPSHWFSFNRRCYKYLAPRVTWADAELHCVSLGANLVSIHSLQEQDFVHSLIRLHLNVAKTREMVINFQKKWTATQPLHILGEHMVEEYLVVYLNSRLSWRTNTDSVYRKGMSRLCFLRKLRSFNVCSRMLEVFYQPVASALYFAVVCWGSSIRAGDKYRPNLLISQLPDWLQTRLS
nr:PREDICTED: snaclec trimecetin subunit alpha-like [Stegastes partitus]